MHHIQPHSKEHLGPDEHENMIVLCPNHHVLFDIGLIAINPEDHSVILHTDHNNPLHNTKLKTKKHQFSSVCVRYHYEQIFKPLYEKLNSI